MVALGVGFQVASLGTWYSPSAHLQAPCFLGQADLVLRADSKGTDPMIGKALFTWLCLQHWGGGIRQLGEPKVFVFS